MLHSSSIQTLFQAYTIFPSALNKIQKKVFILATIINTLEKNTTKFKSKNTTPGEQKGEAIVYSVQQLLNLILYRSQFRSL